MVRLVALLGVVAASLVVASSAGAVDRPVHVVTTVSPGPHFFGDPIHTDAVVTVILYRDLTVTANFALRADELNPAKIEAILQAIKNLAVED